jgi:hypothetical protein
MANLLIDNDVLIKCSCYALLNQVRRSEADSTDVGILGAARFVVRSHLSRGEKIKDREAAIRRFLEYTETAEILEPTEEELMLSSLIEELAINRGLDLDSGESQLCAIAIKRGGCLILTGDKRAICGAELLLSSLPKLEPLHGRLVCLEQAIRGIVERIGADTVKPSICAEPGIDKSLSICFGCSNSTSLAFDPAGLISYINDVRRNAPKLLYRREFL